MWLSDVSLLVLAQQVANGPDNWILLAMPLFVLAGLLMNATGIADRIFALARALVGHIRGGLALVNVVDSMLFGGLSGSATADSAALGSIIIPAMAREGYPPAFAAALTSSTASIGIIVPPSITMIIYGSVAGVSVGALFVAGIVPGILVVLVQGLTVYAIARSRGWGGDTRFSWRGLGRAIRDAWLALIMPLIIIGGIVFAVFTPTEAGAVAVVYGVVVGFVFRALSLRSLYRALVDSAILTAIVMILVSTSISLTLGVFPRADPAAPHGLVPHADPGPHGLAPHHHRAPARHRISLARRSDPVDHRADPTARRQSREYRSVAFRRDRGLHDRHRQPDPARRKLALRGQRAVGRGIMEITMANIPFILVMTALMYLLLFMPQLVVLLPRLAGLA